LYALKFTSAALADIRSIPKHLRNRLKKELQNKVSKDPIACSKELQRELTDFRSFSFGDYRVVYKVLDNLKVVAFVGAGLRSPQSQTNIYRKLETLAKSGELAQIVLFSLKGASEDGEESK